MLGVGRSYLHLLSHHGHSSLLQQTLLKHSLFDATTMKRIIILCDGTGQSASRGELAVPTNVHRFGHAVLNDPKKSGVEQVVFYQSGVGTADLGWLGDIKQGAVGDGIENNIMDGYNFLLNNYLPGDEVRRPRFMGGTRSTDLYTIFPVSCLSLGSPEERTPRASSQTSSHEWACLARRSLGSSS